MKVVFHNRGDGKARVLQVPRRNGAVISKFTNPFEVVHYGPVDNGRSLKHILVYNYAIYATQTTVTKDCWTSKGLF